MLNRELERFLAAWIFLTRIPIPYNFKHSEEAFAHSSRYYPWVGLLLGFLASGIYLFISTVSSQSIAILLSMMSTIYFTGAFHEDGFADTCDGFGGGWNKEERLRIMKDSRLGTYGVTGLGMILALKYFALKTCAENKLPLALMAGHSLSRWMATLYITHLPYIQEENHSKVKPVVKNLSSTSILIGGSAVWLPLCFFAEANIFWILCILSLSYFVLFQKFKRNLGGYTGDCLGAAQQIFEVVWYLSITIFFKDIT